LTVSVTTTGCNSNNNSDPNIGLIVGVTIGAVVAAAAIVVVAVILSKRHRQRSAAAIVMKNLTN
jgi:gas vesicle protein